MTKEVAVSERFSFKGWRLWKWITGNKESIKFALSAILAYSFFTTGYGIVISSFIGVFSKLVFDTADYFVSEVEVEEAKN